MRYSRGCGLLPTKSPSEDAGMAARLQDKKADLLESVVGRLHDRLVDDQAAMAEVFLRQYYRSVSPAELVARDPLDLYGAALAHLRFGEHRRPGHAKVRVYNPHVEQHGWQSTHTVVEVVTDDMPFLVDSVSMALNRLGLLIHLTIHPVVPVRRDRGLATDARQDRGRARRSQARRQSGRCRGPGRGGGVPCVDRRQSLHLS